MAEHAEPGFPAATRLRCAGDERSDRSREPQDRGDDADGRDEDEAEVDQVVVDSLPARVHAAPPSALALALTMTVPDFLPMNTTSPGWASSSAGGRRSRAVPSVLAT